MARQARARDESGAQHTDREPCGERARLQLILLVEVGEHETLADSRQAVGDPQRVPRVVARVARMLCPVRFESDALVIVHLRGGAE